jgi:hypothetical protein
MLIILLTSCIRTGLYLRFFLPGENFSDSADRYEHQFLGLTGGRVDEVSQQLVLPEKKWMRSGIELGPQTTSKIKNTKQHLTISTVG